MFSLKVSHVICGGEITCIRKEGVTKGREEVSTLLYPVPPGGYCACSWLAVTPA